MATRVRDPAVSRKNQILNAQRQAEWARQRLRMLMENMPPEELDEYIAASEEKESPPVRQ